MEFGFGLPTRGPMATPQNLARLAHQGEELGFAIISVSDHIIIPKAIASTYPYNESGTFAGSPTGECLEQLSLLSFLVGVTSSAKLLTSVMVLPHRPPVLTKYCRFANVAFAPKPLQKPHPPIWTGGESPVALRRAGRLANAWYPIGSNPRFPVATPEQFAGYATTVKHHALESGRDPSALSFAYSTNWYTDQQALTLPNGQRRPLTGTSQQIADDIKGYQEVGVRHMMVNLQGETLAQTLERMQRFADRIMPLAA